MPHTVTLHCSVSGLAIWTSGLCASRRFGAKNPDHLDMPRQAHVIMERCKVNLIVRVFRINSFRVSDSLPRFPSFYIVHSVIHSRKSYHLPPRHLNISAMIF